MEIPNSDEFTHDFERHIAGASVRAAFDLFRIVSSGDTSEETTQRLQYYQKVLPRLRSLAEAMNLPLDTLEQRVLSLQGGSVVPQALLDSPVQSLPLCLESRIPEAVENHGTEGFSKSPQNLDSSSDETSSKKVYQGLKHYLCLNNVPAGKQQAIIARILPAVRGDAFLSQHSRVQGRGRVYIDTPEVRTTIAQILSSSGLLNGRLSCPPNLEKQDPPSPNTVSPYAEKEIPSSRIPYSIVKIAERTSVPEEFILKHESVLEIASDKQTGRTYNPAKIGSLVALWTRQQGALNDSK